MTVDGSFLMAARDAATVYQDDVEMVQRMAQTLAEIRAEKDGTFPEEFAEPFPHELIERGYTIDHVNRLWAEAKAQAFFEARISKR